jgi:RNA polymerase sigma factor (sigma-70 family)
VTWSVSAAVIDKMVHVSNRIVRNRAVAEEIAQEALLRAWTRWDSIEDPNSWLVQTTRRLSLNMLRDDRTRRSAVMRHADFMGIHQRRFPEDAYIGLVEERRRDQLLRAVDGLVSPFRELAEALLAHDGAASEVGRALGLPPGTLASRMSRLRAKLKEHMAEREDAP